MITHCDMQATCLVHVCQQTRMHTWSMDMCTLQHTHMHAASTYGCLLSNEPLP
jgi:hypothetical protein